MEISILVSMALVALYIGLVCYRKGEIPENMGAVAYLLPDGGWRWLWSVWLWSTVYTLTPKLFVVIPDAGQPCAHAFATAMLLLGILPLLKHEGNKGVYALATVACFFSQVCVALVCPWFLLTWLSMPAMLAGRHCWRGLEKVRQRLVMELSCYVSLAGSLLVT